ncbi:hypothetical protein [Pleionea sediminis]|uniref:hypothetical protein n=1 Tax=Pleionea sediminis TaxID=2569479 RepID=UPI0013DDEE88|nr:hypothetical protein [Pleionea sediminis]
MIKLDVLIESSLSRAMIALSFLLLFSIFVPGQYRLVENDEQHNRTQNVDANNNGAN